MTKISLVEVTNCDYRLTMKLAVERSTDIVDLALLAQSVARVTLNHKVRGSSPLQGFIFFPSGTKCFNLSHP